MKGEDIVCARASRLADRGGSRQRREKEHPYRESYVESAPDECEKLALTKIVACRIRLGYARCSCFDGVIPLDIGCEHVRRSGRSARRLCQCPFKFTSKLNKLTTKLDRPQLTPDDIKKIKEAAASAADAKPEIQMSKFEIRNNHEIRNANHCRRCSTPHRRAWRARAPGGLISDAINHYTDLAGFGNCLETHGHHDPCPAVEDHLDSDE